MINYFFFFDFKNDVFAHDMFYITILCNRCVYLLITGHTDKNVENIAARKQASKENINPGENGK